MRIQSAVKYPKKRCIFGGQDFYACLMVKEGTRESILASTQADSLT